MTVGERSGSWSRIVRWSLRHCPCYLKLISGVLAWLLFDLVTDDMHLLGCFDADSHPAVRAGQNANQDLMSAGLIGRCPRLAGLPGDN